MDDLEPNRSKKRRWFERELGQTLVEYTLILALFSFVVIGGLGAYRGGLGGLYSTMGAAMESLFP